jgi:hypothetical protein
MHLISTPHPNTTLHHTTPPPGMLQLAPVVSPAIEQLNSALKRAGRVAPSAAIKNEAEKERNRAARQLDTLMKELSVPLTRYLAGFPRCEGGAVGVGVWGDGDREDGSRGACRAGQEDEKAAAPTDRPPALTPHPPHPSTPRAAALHPFEAALLDLTVGRGTYQSVLGKVG